MPGDEGKVTGSVCQAILVKTFKMSVAVLMPNTFLSLNDIWKVQAYYDLKVTNSHIKDVFLQIAGNSMFEVF